MAIRRTTALINGLAGGYGISELLTNGFINVYSGAQPSDADNAPSGTLLLTYSLNGNAYADATRAMASIAIGGTIGTLDEVTVGGMGYNLLASPVSYNSSATVTVSDIVTNINSKQNPLNIVAVQNSTTLELYTPHMLGANANGLTFATSVTGGLTATSSGTFSGGVTATNGINFSETVTSGSISKTSEVWQGSGITSGVAGWFRFVPCGSNADGVGTDNVRFDGSVGTSNADMIISSTSIVESSVYTISSGNISEAKE